MDFENALAEFKTALEKTLDPTCLFNDASPATWNLITEKCPHPKQGPDLDPNLKSKTHYRCSGPVFQLLLGSR